MDKLLVTVYIPMIEQEYEIYMPLNKKFGVIRSLLIKSINELSEGGLNNNWDLKLYENDIILSIVQISNFILVIWIIITGFYWLYRYFHNKYD